MDIKQTFLDLTTHTVPYGKEIDYLGDKLPMSILKKDEAGNLYIKIGESNTMFASHLDTVGGDVEVVHVIEKDKIKTKNSVLGADDKAGVTVMLYMIHNGVPGLYVFFMGEEVGCRGSKALASYIEKNPNDELYKSINKVISFDRKGYGSVITYQMSERCCSDDFANSLIKELNKHNGLNFSKDTGGILTDSVQFTDIYAECTNLSVGYFAQHTNNESQDIVWLQKFADACIKVNWEGLTIKRKPGESERLYSGGYSRGVYNDWEDDYYGYGYGGYSGNGWRDTRSGVSAGNNNRGNSNNGYVTDYKGSRIKESEAVWCKYDNEWCPKDEAVWVDLIGFYTTPDNPPKEKKTTINLPSTTSSSEYINSNGSEIKSADNIKPGDKVIHKNFGSGKVVSLSPDKTKAVIDFPDTKRTIHIGISKMKKDE